MQFVKIIAIMILILLALVFSTLSIRSFMRKPAMIQKGIIYALWTIFFLFDAISIFYKM
jgi:lysophospholipid acyltransferase (LPLAT)-like uncharacterized protein